MGLSIASGLSPGASIVDRLYDGQSGQVLLAFCKTFGFAHRLPNAILMHAGSMPSSNHDTLITIKGRFNEIFTDKRTSIGKPHRGANQTDSCEAKIFKLRKQD
jgi:hypothetical protein